MNNCKEFLHFHKKKHFINHKSHCLPPPQKCECESGGHILQIRLKKSLQTAYFPGQNLVDLQTAFLLLSKNCRFQPSFACILQIVDLGNDCRLQNKFQDVVKFLWCRWGSSLLGLRTLDPLLSPPSTPVEGQKLA